MHKINIKEMSSVVVTVTLLGIVFASISGCGLFSKSTEYQVPAYYETSQVTTQPVVGRAYYINNLRCGEFEEPSPAGCQQLEKKDRTSNRDYTKPYYLSK